MEKEVTQLKAELGVVRSQVKEAEGRAIFSATLAAEKGKSLEEAEGRAVADAKRIKKLEADLSAARKQAVEDFLASQDFADRQLDFASLWVLDAVSQCRRLCKEKLGTGDFSFLVPSEVARVVEARRQEGAEITLDSESSSEEEDDAPGAAEEPNLATSVDPPADPAV